jgi:hypothetical protein
MEARKERRALRLGARMETSSEHRAMIEGMRELWDRCEGSREERARNGAERRARGES